MKMKDVDTNDLFLLNELIFFSNTQIDTNSKRKISVLAETEIFEYSAKYLFMNK